MGVTNESLKIINRAIANRDIKLVCDLGAQNLYTTEIVQTNPSRYPYVSDWWKVKGCQYVCIDLNGENDALRWDLSEPIPPSSRFDLVMDFGTSEHVRDIYQCHKNIDELCKVEGLIIHENPKTGNWPEHCFHYYTMAFYIDLAKRCDYKVIELGETVAMGNTETGNNVYCVMEKTREGFIERDQFPQTFTK